MEIAQGMSKNICTVGTKILADPRKRFHELITENLLNLLRDRPWLELNIAFSNFQALLLARQITGISRKVINSSEKVLNITGPARSELIQ